MASTNGRRQWHPLIQELSQEMEEACDDLVEQYCEAACQIRRIPNKDDTLSMDLWCAVFDASYGDSDVQLSETNEAPVPWHPLTHDAFPPPTASSPPNRFCRAVCTTFTQDLPPSKCHLRNAKKSQTQPKEPTWKRSFLEGRACLSLQHKQGSSTFRFFWSDLDGKGCDPRYVHLVDDKERLAEFQAKAFFAYEFYQSNHCISYNRDLAVSYIRHRLKQLVSNNGPKRSDQTQMPLLHYKSPLRLIWNDPGTLPGFKELLDGYDFDSDAYETLRRFWESILRRDECRFF